MSLKRIWIFILPLFFIFPTLKMVQAAPTEKHSLGYTQIKNIQKIIGDKTPSFLSKPIIATLDKTEGFRTSMAKKTEGKALSVVFKYWVIFYGILAFLVGLILRSLWRLIF